MPKIRVGFLSVPVAEGSEQNKEGETKVGQLEEIEEEREYVRKVEEVKEEVPSSRREEPGEEAPSLPPGWAAAAPARARARAVVPHCAALQVQGEPVAASCTAFQKTSAPRGTCAACYSRKRCSEWLGDGEEELRSTGGGASELGPGGGGERKLDGYRKGYRNDGGVARALG
ncbi:Protein of unknown function [Gryllus bimaculatus]|nr:Protein of unknown function [Gryllus bimaculatus]